MQKYVSIEYSGPYSSLVKFIESKDLKFEIKPVQPGKALLKIADDLLDDVFFLSDAVIDETKNEKINVIKEISENEFNDTSENGFEIIHNDDHSHKTPATLLTQETITNTQTENVQTQQTNPITTETDIDRSKSTSINNTVTDTVSNIAGTVVFPSPSVPVNITSEKPATVPKTDEEKLNRISIGLRDTILPSKSPLPSNDPFNYLTSRTFLTYFSAAATITIFVLALFD
jgi:hypothetical protein